MTSEAALEGIYSAARYEVDMDDGRALAFHIGEPVPGLAGESFALITAFNPRSVPRSEEWNGAANARLETRLRELGFAYLLGRGMSPDESHVEPSFAVLGITRARALALAREFEQAAIVWFDGRSAELAWTEEAGAARGT